MVDYYVVFWKYYSYLGKLFYYLFDDDFWGIMGNIKLVNSVLLGLMGFGMIIILFNLYNVGYFVLDGIIFVMGIFYGGIV